MFQFYTPYPVLIYFDYIYFAILFFINYFIIVYASILLLCSLLGIIFWLLLSTNPSPKFLEVFANFSRLHTSFVSIGSRVILELSWAWFFVNSHALPYFCEICTNFTLVFHYKPWVWLVKFLFFFFECSLKVISN